MNELRMYVEHLFEGRVLTPENIELKEEIYGNLVARYEDLLADGVDEAEALRRTKESMASVDDVLDGDAFDHDDAAVATSGEAPVEEAPAAVTTSLDEHAAAATTPLGAADAVEPGATRPGGPTPVTEPGTATLHPQPEQPVKRRRVWPLVLVFIVAIVLLLGIGLASCSLMTGVRAFTQDANVSVGKDGVHVEDGNNVVDVSPNGGVSVYSEDSGIVVEPDGTVILDGEAGDELIRSVVNSNYNDVATYVGKSFDDVDSLDVLIFNLPMGEWAANLDVTRGNGVLRFDYVRVPSYFEGESVGAALAYNVTALFCAVPDAQKIQVTVSESDEVNEHECYVFNRATVEEMYGVPLNAEMVNEAGWKQLKNDNLYKHDFAERMLDRAESDAR